MKKHRKEILISVIIPCYGTEETLERCLKSVLSQETEDMEIILVDDGSPGDPAGVLAPYMETDRRISLIRHEQNLGLYRARLTGAAAASGRYLYFMDSDDFLSPGYLYSLLERAEGSGAEICLGAFVSDEEGECFRYPLHAMVLDCGRLEGEAVQDFFFGGELACFGIHTMWNRLIRKTLWDRALPDLEKLEGHIVMTEDIAFSTVLYYEARSLAGVPEEESEAYHYCKSRGSATDVRDMDLMTFRKRLQDLTRVFSFGEAYLQRKKAPDGLKAHFHEGRRRYGRLWKQLAEKAFGGRNRKAALALVRNFCPDAGTPGPEDTWYESVKDPWTGGLSYLAGQAGETDREWISFDCFDTLLTRPFYEPSDLFLLLDPLYRKLTGAAGSFAALRIRGEQAARAAGRIRGLQDIGIDEIYKVTGCLFGIPRDALQVLKEEEIRLEMRFCRRRRSGGKLYDRARRAGRKILILSDMYLPSSVLGGLLARNGFEGWEGILVSSEEGVLKEGGDLYRRCLQKYPQAIGRILHIGDSWKADVEGSRRAGIPSLFFPSEREVFEDRIRDCPAGKMADPAGAFLGRLFERKSSPPFRCMQALVMQACMDDPYRSFGGSGFFGGDPWILGYYGVGMHLTGLALWMEKIRKSRGAGRIWYLSRDGDLPMKVRNILKGEEGAGYLYCSRRALLPFMVREPADFFQLPLSPPGHSPESLSDLLSFCRGPSMKETEEIFRRAGKSFHSLFTGREDLEEAVRLFLESCYSREKHEEAMGRIREYFSCVRPGDMFFDTGMSGRIQGAVCRAAGFPADVFYICEDREESFRTKEAGGFRILSLYPFQPRIRGMMREILLSDPGGTCTGYRRENGRTVPVLEEKGPGREESLVLERIRRGALAFAEDFKETFGEEESLTDIDPTEASLPLEGMLAGMTDRDLALFAPFFFEDRLYGGSDRIRAGALYRTQLSEAGFLPAAREEPAGKGGKKGPAFRSLARRIFRLRHDGRRKERKNTK